MLKQILSTLLIVILVLPSFALQPKKEIMAIRVSKKPLIDGILDDSVWKGVPVANNFIQMEPDNGAATNYKTEVKFIYTNNSIIVGAKMYDPEPEKILRTLSKRDAINNADFVSLVIDPFNSGLDAFEFIVTASGVQWDAKVVKSREDTSWDAVWNSATSIHEDGWSTEIEIPYSALRFPSKEIQEWGVNFLRNIQRDREKTSWNFIDKEEDGWINQSGVLRGVENVEPPVRLSFTPYFSAYYDKFSDESKGETNFRGGMDLKYGINESYTLDMMLIPDFGQVQSDDEVLNLSPFETKFSEKRQFFTEATELFNRGGVFYSRRIGGKPRYAYDVYDNLGENEIVTDNPAKAKIINATKVSGRNSKGLGIGVLNAMNRNTYASIKDTVTGESRKEKIQPFTNYNMLVVDKSLKNESFVSLFNTNVYIPETDYIANVTGTEFDFRNEKRSHNVKGKVIATQRYQDESKDQIGYMHEVQVGKIQGKFTWNYFHRVMTDKYNPNDLGFLYRNNQINNNLNFFYDNFEPKGAVIQRHARFQIHHEARYEPRRYTSISLYYNARLKFRDHFAMGFYGNTRPMHRYDYEEPRVSGMKLRKGSSTFAGLWISTDYRKAFALDIDANYGVRMSTDDLKSFRLKVSPRYRVNDKLLMVYETAWSRNLDELGYASSETDINDLTTVYIGNRNTARLENKLSANYIFNNKTSLSFRMRHYWAKAEYKDFYTLMDNGRVADSDYNENHDVNFNTFNVDMVYNWRFAPGSELALVWKSSIRDAQDEIRHGFVDNLKDTFDATQLNSFSVKLIYYIDYMSLKRKG
ncbi:carbohydrate binding family 9 domain-containing protein [Marinifilum sp. D714]|nr:carbohydrate binding family 9 domain-containing protein [Marinifilum sp. D714]